MNSKQWITPWPGENAVVAINTLSSFWSFPDPDYNLWPRKGQTKIIGYFSKPFALAMVASGYF